MDLERETVGDAGPMPARRLGGRTPMAPGAPQAIGNRALARAATTEGVPAVAAVAGLVGPTSLRRPLGPVAPTGPASLDRDAAGPTALTEADIAAMDTVDRLLAAGRYAGDHLAPEVRAELGALLTPETMAGLLAVVAMASAAQLTPAGWVADGLGLAAVTASLFFVGWTLVDILGDLAGFVEAGSATTDGELRRCGAALARAVAAGGVGLLTVLVTRRIQRSVVEAGSGPPPPGAVPALATNGYVVLVEAEAVAAGATGPGLANYAMAVGGRPQRKEPARSGRRSGSDPVEDAAVETGSTRGTTQSAGAGGPSNSVISRIGEHSFLVRRATTLSQQAQADVDALVVQLRAGNVMAAGKGTKSLRGGFLEMRGTNRGRVIVRKVGDQLYEILGKYEAHSRSEAADTRFLERLITTFGGR